MYTDCLAQGTYYIESDDEAAIVDPLRESAPYITKAEERGAKIKYIFETHFHADFVSGHVDLAAKTGATIVYGPNAKPTFDCHVAIDGEIFDLGKIKIKVLYTPGHTMESSSFLLLDEEGKEHALFSGDTLFIGDVGRPDLAQKGAITQYDLAGCLYESLRTKIMPLADEVIIYPAHGAGSACGKHMSSKTSDFLGNQKNTNYALRADMTKGEFVKKVTDELLPPPRYFASNVALNKSTAQGVDAILSAGNVPLNVETFETKASHEGALVLDTRNEKDFVKGHIPNATFIGIDGNFASWVGALIVDIQQPIIFVAPEGREEEVVTRLSRVGYDNTLGFLSGGMPAWKQAGKGVATMVSISATQFAKAFKNRQLNVLDIRKPSEFRFEHIETAQTLPLDFLRENMDQIDQSKQYHVHCAGGYRAVIAVSILKSMGFHNMVDVAGGFNEIKKTDVLTIGYN